VSTKGGDEKIIYDIFFFTLRKIKSNKTLKNENK
jgi:hypothetical protein